MGMLFNTDSTIEILNKTNQTFNRYGINRILKSNLAQTLRNNIPNLSTTANNGIWDLIALPLAIHLDGGSGPRHGRWKTYLAYLDNTNDANSNSNPKKKMAYSIGQAILTVLNDNSYNAIEFFAVPLASGASPAVAVQAVSVGGDKSQVITIFTQDVDLSILINVGNQQPISVNQGSTSNGQPAASQDDSLPTSQDGNN